MSKTRNSNVEILRIISIVLIVISHYSVHNGISNYTLNLGINRFLLETMTLGNIGTVLFVLITGYYMINSRGGVRLKKLFGLWLQIWFYSVSIYIIFCSFGLTEFSIKATIQNLFPITFEQYWFATTYIILYIFHPFINKMLNSLTRKDHLSLILIGLTIFSLLHTMTTKSFYGNDLIQFFLFYSIGAYFSKYNSIFKNNKLNYFLIFVSIFIILLSILIFDMIGMKVPIFAIKSVYLLNRTSPFVILFSICLFNVFINKKHFNSRIINIIASGVFGVYLISDNNYIRIPLWQKIFKNHKYVCSNFLIIHMICAVFLVFIICCLIDLVRKYTIDSVYNKCFSKKIDRFQNFLDLKWNLILNKVYTSK